jgi:hypothetical protein
LSFLPAQEGGAEKQILQEMDHLAPTAIVAHSQHALWKNKPKKSCKTWGNFMSVLTQVHAQVFIH